MACLKFITYNSRNAVCSINIIKILISALLILILRINTIGVSIISISNMIDYYYYVTQNYQHQYYYVLISLCVSITSIIIISIIIITIYHYHYDNNNNYYYQQQYYYDQYYHYHLPRDAVPEALVGDPGLELHHNSIGLVILVVIIGFGPL